MSKCKRSGNNIQNVDDTKAGKLESMAWYNVESLQK